MKLTWSHAVLNVGDLETMLTFYCDVLGFEITDRGPTSEDGPEIVFLSQNPDEHHQLAMIQLPPGSGPPPALNHMAFRTPAFEDLQTLHAALEEVDGIRMMPLSHGNTLSIYFNDPERNGIEVFWDTPWHVAQPQGRPWDVSLDEEAALAWVQEHFGHEDTFEPRGGYYERRREEAGANS